MFNLTTCSKLLLLTGLAVLSATPKKLRVGGPGPDNFQVSKPTDIRIGDSLQWTTTDTTPRWIVFRHDGVCTTSGPNDLMISSTHPATCKLAHLYGSSEQYDICPSQPPAGQQSPPGPDHHCSRITVDSHICSGCIVP